eukprot:scaffold15772_cov162-Cylindrotheca_fusiformis.AAC.3
MDTNKPTGGMKGDEATNRIDLPSTVVSHDSSTHMTSSTIPIVAKRQPKKNLKVVTAFATVGVGIQGLFFSDYDIQGHEGEEHVFSNVQRDTRKWIDRNIYRIDLEDKNSKPEK